MRIVKIKGVNLGSEPHTLDVVVFDRDDPVHESSHELAASADDGDDGESFVLDEALPKSAGAYVLEATVDGTATERMDLASEFGGRTVGVIVDVDRRGRPTFYVSLYPE